MSHFSSNANQQSGKKSSSQNERRRTTESVTSQNIHVSQIYLLKKQKYSANCSEEERDTMSWHDLDKVDQMKTNHHPEEFPRTPQQKTDT